ncbi:MAG: hypothetical protein QW440_05865, partial [Saccharolobus sp.]
MIKTLSEYLIILIPILVNIGIFHTLKTVKALSIISSIIILVLSILLHFKSPMENETFFITKFTALLLTMISSIYLLSVLYSLDYIKSLKGIIKEKTYYVFAIPNNIRLMLRKLLKPEGEKYIPSYGLDVFWEYMYKIAKSLRTFGRKFGRTLINSSILWYIT